MIVQKSKPRAAKTVGLLTTSQLTNRMLPELSTAGDRSHSAAPFQHIQTEKHTDSYSISIYYSIFPCSFWALMSVLPLWPASSDTPAAAAGSRSWGRRRSGQPWLRTDTPPSRSGWRSSGRPPPWWCCGRRPPGCGKHSTAICHHAEKHSERFDRRLWLENARFICWGLYLPVHETGSTIQAAFMDEADAVFKMLRTGEGQQEALIHVLQLLTNCPILYTSSWQRQCKPRQTGTRDFTSVHSLKKSCMMDMSNIWKSTAVFPPDCWGSDDKKTWLWLGRFASQL